MGKIFITGGSGLIGSIVNKKLSKNHEIINLDLYESNINSTKTVIGDMNNFEDVLSGSKGCSAIIHLGAVIEVNTSCCLLYTSDAADE